MLLCRDGGKSRIVLYTWLDWLASVAVVVMLVQLVSIFLVRR